MSDSGCGSADCSVIVVTLIVGATAFVLYYISSLLRSSKEEENAKSSEVVVEQKEKVSTHSSAPKASKKNKQEKWGRDSKQRFAHPWLLTSLKGHTGKVSDMDFSSNGKFLATCAEDRAILIWSTKDWHQNDHKSLRINVEFDHASFVKWSPDSKAFIVQKVRENAVEVYKVNKRPDGWIGSVSKALTFPKHEGWDAVVGLGIACSGKFIMSCSDKTELVLWDLKGQQLAKVDTYLMNNYCARISPCGRFVAASGFTPDVKVWEVCFAKTGEFHQVSRAFELSGHSSGVYDFSFNADSSRIATVSKDGTWKAYNTKIEFQKGEDPHLLMTGKYNHKSAGPSHVAISPNGEVVVVADGGSLSFYSVLTGECDNTIRDIYSGDIVCVQFDSLGKFVLAAGDKHVHVFHNVTGYRATIASIQAKFKQATMSSAQKERMEQQIQEAQDFLKGLKEQSS